MKHQHKFFQVLVIIGIVTLTLETLVLADNINCNELKARISQEFELTQTRESNSDNSFLSPGNNQNLDIFCNINNPFINLNWQNGFPRNEFYQSAAKIMKIYGRSDQSLNERTAKFCILYSAKKEKDVTLYYRDVQLNCHAADNDTDSTLITIGNLTNQEKKDIAIDTRKVPDAPWLREVVYLNDN